MSCKPTLSRQVDSLYAQFTSKTRQSNPPSSAPSERARSTEGRQCIFLKGELLMFSEMTRSEVVTALQNMGLVGSAVTIITEGDPLYFVDESTSDTYKPFDYFLQHSDLPYGFAGPGGTFQFSSPEIAALQKSSAPVIIDDAYVYGGSDGATISYENVRNYNAFLSPGLGWTQSNEKQPAYRAVDRGEFPHITLKNDFGVLDRRDLVDKNELQREIMRQPYAWLEPEVDFQGGIGGSNYNPGKYIGWRLPASGSYVANFSSSANLLVMPEGQLAEFQVNPSNQQPYRGAEGVYPVILVELNEDVNMVF